MKLHEHQAKGVFDDAGIPVPDSTLASTVEEAVEAAEAGNARLVVDEDQDNELEGEERRQLYGVLRHLLPEAGVPVVKEDGKLVPYFPTGRWEDVNEAARKAERLLREEFEKATIPEGSPAPGARSWAECFDQHLLGSIRSARGHYEMAADAAVTAWEKNEAVQTAVLNDLWDDIRRETAANEWVRRTSATSFELVQTDGWGENAPVSEVLGEVTEPPADIHEVRQFIRSLR